MRRRWWICCCCLRRFTATVSVSAQTNNMRRKRMPKSYGLDRAGPLMGHVSHSDSCWPASPLSHPFRTWAYSFHVITLTCHYVYYGSEEREPCHPHLTGAAAAIPPDRGLPRLRRPHETSPIVRYPAGSACFHRRGGARFFFRLCRATCRRHGRRRVGCGGRHPRGTAGGGGAGAGAPAPSAAGPPIALHIGDLISPVTAL
jgi:hypothetical protein